MIELTLEQAALKAEVEAYLDFERMHYEVTQSQLERDLLELYGLHGMVVPREKVRQLAQRIAEYRTWQEDAYGSTDEVSKWWREGPEARKTLPDPDPSTHCTSRTLRPGG